MKVLIADDHALFRDALGKLIESLDNSATVIQAANYLQTLKMNLKSQPVMPDWWWCQRQRIREIFGMPLKKGQADISANVQKAKFY